MCIRDRLIAEMDRVTLQSELASQKATYDGAKAEYEYQEKNFQRSKGLHEKSLISCLLYTSRIWQPQNNPAEQKHAERMIQLWGDKFKK